MAHRTKKGQEIHDNKVAEIAKGLDKLGYLVEADLPGHHQPPSLGGTRPDIRARKGPKVVIREIETPSSLSPDKKQQETLRKWARGHRADYRTIVTKKKK